MLAAMATPMETTPSRVTTAPPTTSSATPMTRPPVRVRLQTLPPLPPLRCWFEVLPGDPSVAHLARRIASALGIAAAPTPLVLQLDGFALLLSSTAALVRDGDLLHVALGTDAIPVPTTPVAPSPTDAGLAHVQTHTHAPAALFDCIAVAPIAQLSAAAAPKTDEPAILKPTAPTNDNNDDVADISMAMSEPQSASKKRRGKRRRKKTTESAAASDADQTNDSITLPSLAPEFAVVAQQPKPKQQNTVTTDPIVIAAPVTILSNTESPHAFSTSTAVSETASETTSKATSIRLPAGLTRTKLKAIRTMLNTERTHVRFDENDAETNNLNNKAAAGDNDDETQSENASLPFRISRTCAKLHDPPRILNKLFEKTGDGSNTAVSTFAGNGSKSKKKRQKMHEQDQQEQQKQEQQQQRPSKKSRKAMQESSKSSPSIQPQVEDTSVQPYINTDIKNKTRDKENMGRHDTNIDADQMNNTLEGEILDDHGEEDDEDEDVDTHDKCSTKTVSKTTKKPDSSPSLSVTDYTSLPYLQGLPRIGMTIAFKMLEMTSSYTPQVSAYKQATVMDVNPGGTVVSLKIDVSGVNACPDPSDTWGNDRYSKHGRFELSTDEDDDVDGDDDSDNMILVELASLIEVRLVKE